LGIDTTVKNGLVLIPVAAITTLDVFLIALSFCRLKGIEGFTSLTTLNCSGTIWYHLSKKHNYHFKLLNNPTLVCIQVAILLQLLLTTTKDATASFSLDCTITLIPDAKFEEKFYLLWY
jgi:hypothetical protein